MMIKLSSGIGRATGMLLIALTLTSCTAMSPASDDSAVAQAILDEICEIYRFPGATAAIIFSDGEVVSVACGYADIEAGTPMTPDSRMLAASIGKTFTAATVLSLEEAGQLSLDDPLSIWLGDRDWFRRLPNGGTATIRHLLSHRAGLPDHVHMTAFREAWSGGQVTLSPETLIGFVLDEAPLFEAGQGWSYSDTGYLLLGLVIEAVTGRAYEYEISNRFLIPLRLSDTGPSNTREIENLATGYVSESSGLGLPRRTVDVWGRMVWNPGVEWTGGGLYSTSADLARWGHALFRGRVLSKHSTDVMAAGMPTLAGDITYEYGLGVAIQTESPWGRSYGHRGWIPGYVSSLRYFPERGVAIAFQTNTDIGILGEDRPVVLEVENRIAAAYFSSRR